MEVILQSHKLHLPLVFDEQNILSFEPGFLCLYKKSKTEKCLPNYEESLREKKDRKAKFNKSMKQT